MADLLAARRITYWPGSGIPMSDPLSVMNRLFCGWLVRDRFNILNKYLPFRMADIADEVPVADESLTIADICDAKANEILAMNCPVTVSWSGGVDSTAVVSALLKNGLSADALTVVHASSSKTEYPWFYKHLAALGVNLKETEAIAKAFDKVKDGVILTGWNADQLFGSNIHLLNLDLYSMPWIDGLKQAFADRNISLTNSSYEVLESVWSGYAKHVGVEVEQFCEFAWLYNFGCKWSYVSQDSKLACKTQAARDRVINFFEDDRFQKWSMANYPKIREVNVNRLKKFYKRPLKRYIYSYTNDPDYLNKKGKVNSWALVHDASDFQTCSTLDTDGYHVFRLKGNPSDVDMLALRDAVAKKYLKET